MAPEASMALVSPVCGAQQNLAVSLAVANVLQELAESLALLALLASA